MDKITSIGHVRVVKTDPKTGLILFDEVFKNQLTYFALQQAASLWSGQFVVVPSMIAVGTGSPPADQSSTTANDITLWTELDGTRQTVDYATTWLQYYTQYSVTYMQSQAIGTIDSENPTGLITLTEAGLFDINGNLWSHVMLNGVTHDNTSTLSIQWQIEQQGN